MKPVLVRLMILLQTTAFVASLTFLQPSFASGGLSAAAIQTLQEKSLAAQAITAANGAKLTAAGVKPTIIVFWASIGYGHLSAAQSVKADLEKVYPGANVILKDARDFQNPIRKWIAGHMYDLITKQASDKYDSWYSSYMATGAKIESPGQMTVGQNYHPDQFLKFIREQNASMVVSAFNHATEALISLRDEGKLSDVKIAQIMTDYVDEDYFSRMGEHVDMTFVPHKEIEDSFISKGLDPKKIATSGIPVRAIAFDPLTPEDRVVFLSHSGLDPDVKTIFLASGSAGVGDFPGYVTSIVKAFGDQPLQIVAVTAKNQRQFAALSALQVPSNIKLKVLAKIENGEMLSYMKASDLIITKTGGLTASEVMAIGKPAIFLDINGGQERYNSQFFMKNGMGMSTRSTGDVGPLAYKILSDPGAQAAMIKAQLTSEEELDRGAVTTWIVNSYLKDTKVYASAPQLSIVPSKPNQYKEAPGKALFLSDEAEVGQARLDMTRQENEEIFAAYLLFDGNKLGRVALAQGLAKAKSGVKVRLIVDSWAYGRWLDEAIDKPTIAALAKYGAEIRFFNPVDMTSKMTYLHPSNFRRLHDKLLYLKGQKVVFTGDRNMQNVNFRAQKTNGQTGKSYRSTEVMLQSSMTEDIHEYMEKIWALSKTEDTSDVSQAEIEKAEQDLGRVLDVMDKNYPTKTDWAARMQPVDGVRFMSDVPGSKGVVFPVDDEIIAQMDSAKKSLVLVSPYIRLTKEMYAAVVRAIGRGVDVTVQTVARHNTDAKTTSIAFESQAIALQKLGVKVMMFDTDDLMHAKLLRVDDETTLVMAHNMNRRSRNTDEESGVIIRSKSFAAKADGFLKGISKDSIPYQVPNEGLVKACKNVGIRFLIKLPVLRDQL